MCSGGVDQCLILEVSNPDEIAEYCVTITDVNGCEFSDCLFVRERLVKDVYFPNIFAPFSNDAAERIFFIQAQPNYVELVNSFDIFDRWGELVFSAQPNHPPNEKEFGWDGLFNGQNVEQGVYVYRVQVSYSDGTQETFVGDITVIR